MASNSFFSGKSDLGKMRSSAPATALAESAIAAEREGLTEGMGKEPDLRVEGSSRDFTVGPDGDLLDAALRLAQLGFTMAFQMRAALIGGYGVIELGLAILKL